MQRSLPLILFFFACETFDINTDNPLDPNNPDYNEPTISISGVDNNQTIITNNIDITLKGNENVSEYRYQILSSDPFIDMGSNWSEGTASNIISLEYLNEFTYLFVAQSRYLTEEVSANASVTFTVDAVKPSSLLFYPNQLQSDIFENSTFELYAHDLPNVSVLEFIIEYGASSISFAPDEGSVEYGDVNVVTNLSSNRIQYTIGKYGDNGFDQNALIAKIVFKAQNASGTSAVIKILSPIAKSLDGQTIEIVGTNQARVDVR